jgi:hypothetical protein
MSIRFHRYGVLLAFLVLGATTACERERSTVIGPTALTSTTGTTFRFEPATLRAELVPGISCVAGPAFGTRIIVIVGGDVVLRGLRFSFTDRFGVNALPRVVAIPGASPLSTPASAIPTSFPIPIPGIAPLPASSPIPMPGSSSFNGLSGTSLHLPFFLLFGCGVASEGTLFVATELAEPDGRLKTSEFRVRVGS